MVERSYEDTAVYLDTFRRRIVDMQIILSSEPVPLRRMKFSLAGRGKPDILKDLLTGDVHIVPTDACRPCTIFAWC